MTDERSYPAGVPCWIDTDQPDVDAARGLGATVISSEDTEWTRTALIRDPQAAELTLSQFTPPGG